MKDFKEKLDCLRTMTGSMTKSSGSYILRVKGKNIFNTIDPLA